MIQHARPEGKIAERVVVLGATGAVGRALVEHLEAGSVNCVPLASADIDLTLAESASRLGDLLQPEDALVFISALTPDRGRDIRTLMKNLTMGEQVCEVLKESSCAQVVLISSDAVYPDGESLIRESTPAGPDTFHGIMNLARERMLIDTLSESDTPLLILRPSLLYGPTDTHNGYGPNRFVRLATAGDSIRLFGQGEEKRDHVFLGDVANLIGMGLGHRSRGTLNVATGEAVSFMHVAETVVGKLDTESEIECLERSQPITHRHFDVTLLCETYPTFAFTSLDEGLDRMIGAVRS